MRNAVLPVQSSTARYSGTEGSVRDNKATAQHKKEIDGASDGELLTLYQNGNAHAFAELYKRRHLEIYRYILHFLRGDADVAADVFQETFIKLHDHAHSLRDIHNVRAWMYTVARNNCLNIIKRNGKLVRMTEQHENREDESTVAPDEALEKSALREALDDAIESLPDNQREAVILREFEGLSYSEIAKATNTNIGIIRQRLWRAKQSLRTALAARFLEND